MIGKYKESSHIKYILLGNRILSLGELSSVLDRDAMLPEEVDTPYVCKYEIADGEDDANYFRFAYSTKRYEIM